MPQTDQRDTAPDFDTFMVREGEGEWTVKGDEMDAMDT